MSFKEKIPSKRVFLVKLEEQRLVSCEARIFLTKFS